MITDAVALEHGWFPQVLRTYDEGNALWKRVHGDLRAPELEGHGYQVVMYQHAEALLDGELVVVVDKNTGAVLKTIAYRWRIARDWATEERRVVL
jgi:hypothetical protein